MVKDTPAFSPPAAPAIISADFLFAGDKDFQREVLLFYDTWQAHQLLHACDPRDYARNCGLAELREVYLLRGKKVR
jgi:hypothetical protein